MCIIAVSALAAEWIEIQFQRKYRKAAGVSALAAEWIEIISRFLNVASSIVSALAAEWIEIMAGCGGRNRALSLRPRGGVD